jgi:hypothetical protein
VAQREIAVGDASHSCLLGKAGAEIYMLIRTLRPGIYHKWWHYFNKKIPVRSYNVKESRNFAVSIAVCPNVNADVMVYCFHV